MKPELAHVRLSTSRQTAVRPEIKLVAMSKSKNLEVASVEMDDMDSPIAVLLDGAIAGYEVMAANSRPATDFAGEDVE
jgi:hypothetical protein